MSPGAIERLVTKLYAAAGAREATDVDFEVYHEALEDVSDDRGMQACRELIKGVDLVTHKPSPALVIETARHIANREYLNRCETHGLPEATGEPVAPREAQEWIATLRAKTRGGGEPQSIGEALR